MKAKYAKFYEDLTEYLQNLDRNSVKERIGDSTNNNRSLTVSQVIRFLETRRKPEIHQLSENLASVYTLIRPNVLRSRKARNNRTDAVDINEFLKTYESRVIYTNKFGNLRKNVSKVVNFV